MALRLLATWFVPTFAALSPYQHHSLSVRLRLLAFQPLLLLSYSITVFSNGFSGGYTVHLTPTRGRHILRYLVFLPPKWSADVRYPLHICFHSGGFIGGIPESTLPFCQHIAKLTGCIVVSPFYRFAPADPFPAAVEDAEDMLRQLLEVGPKRWNIDTGSITTSGFSASRNLALGLSLHDDFSRKIKACVTSYAPVDKRTPRSQKPKPKNMPNDPLTWVGSLFDTYDPSAGKGELLADNKLAPGEVADITRLPTRMIMVIPTIDILYAEEMKLAERLGEKVEVLEYEDQLHGWLEMPGMGRRGKKCFNAWVFF